MISMLASSAVDRWFEPRSGQTKDYKIGVCCFSAKQAALRKPTIYRTWGEHANHYATDVVCILLVIRLIIIGN
jgi:hypothetical protein